jgi:hypothetical protein
MAEKQVKTLKEKIIEEALKADDENPLKPFKEKVYDAAFAAGRSAGWGDGYLAGKAAEETKAAVLAKQVADAVPVDVAERAKQEWDKTPALREEFTSVESYTAFLKATEAGRVKILGKK